MSYAPPPASPVVFDFTTTGYAPPAHDAVTFDFGSTGGGTPGGGGTDTPIAPGGILVMLIGL